MIDATLSEPMDRVALLALFERARSNLLRARFHKQRVELHQKKVSGRDMSYHIAARNSHSLMAQQYRMLARRDLRALIAAEKGLDALGRSRSLLKASRLNGAEFMYWPTYMSELAAFGRDTWLRRWDNA